VRGDNGDNAIYIAADDSEDLGFQVSNVVAVSAVFHQTTTTTYFHIKNDKKKAIIAYNNNRIKIHHSKANTP